MKAFLLTACCRFIFVVAMSVNGEPRVWKHQDSQCSPVSRVCKAEKRNSPCVHVGDMTVMWGHRLCHSSIHHDHDQLQPSMQANMG